MEEKRSYYAVIPAKVRYDENLSANAKLLYGEITALANETGYCWASNDYFAKLYGVEKRTIRRWIESLKNAGYIFITSINSKEDKNTSVRVMKIVDNIQGQKCPQPGQNCPPPGQKCPHPPDKNVLQNNTSNNKYTSQLFCEQKNSDTKIKKKKTFAPDSDPYLLARFLECNIRRNCPNFAEDEARRQRWAYDMDLMIRRDNLNPDDIAKVIEWAQNDGFWRGNILSGKKLREKYLQLSMKMQKERS